MSFMRCMSSGDMFSMAPDIWLNVLLHELLAQLVEQLVELLAGPRST